MPGIHLLISSMRELMAVIAENAVIAASKRADIYLDYQAEKAAAERMNLPFDQVLHDDIGSLEFIERYRSEVIRECIWHLRRYGSYMLTTGCVLYVDRDYLPGVHPLWLSDCTTWSREGFVGMIGGYAADGSDVRPFQNALIAHRHKQELEELRTGKPMADLVYTTSLAAQRLREQQLAPAESTDQLESEPEVVQVDRNLGTSASWGTEHVRPYYQRKTPMGGHNRSRKLR